MKYRPFESIPKMATDIMNDEPMARRDMLIFMAEISGAGLLAIGGMQGAIELMKRNIGRDGYADMIYSKNEDAENQLYIIGQVHKHPVVKWLFRSGRAQTEVYRTSEELMADNDIGLVLGESYMADYDYSISNQKLHSRAMEKLGKDKVEELKTADNSELVDLFNNVVCDLNAPELLYLNHGIDLQGAEDRASYKKAYRMMLKMLTEDSSLKEPFNNYMHNVRSAKILENAPDVIEREYDAGRITSRKAIAMIGYAHIDEMIEYIDDDRAVIEGIPEHDLPDVDISVGLEEKGYGCTVYRPKSISKSGFSNPFI